MKNGIWTEVPEEAVGSLGEAGVIERIRAGLAGVSPPPPQGIGDDCAVVSGRSGMGLLTSDNLVLGRHFTADTPARLVGRKAINRCVSDIAASGGRPAHGLLNLLLAPQTRRDWLDEFIAGVREACRAAEMELNGGDLTEVASGVLQASVTVMGFSARPLRRGGARPGDQVWVTGELGGSLEGHHLEFIPRIEEGVWLASRPEVVACMDLTDGLAKDLPALLGEGLAVRVGADALPVSAAARRMARASGQSPVWHACNDGEDYELVFVTRPGAADGLPWREGWEESLTTRLTCLGVVEEANGAGGALRDPSGTPWMEGNGFRHFSTFPR